MVEKVGPFHQFWAVSLNSLLCVWVFLIFYVLLMSEVWGCASFFLDAPRPGNRFVSFVRAGEAKLRVCVREIRFLSLG